MRIVLRTTDTKGIIMSREAHNEEGLEMWREFLNIQRQGWYRSDQFIGRGLEIVKLGRDGEVMK